MYFPSFYFEGHTVDTVLEKSEHFPKCVASPLANFHSSDLYLHAAWTAITLDKECGCGAAEHHDCI